MSPEWKLVMSVTLKMAPPCPLLRGRPNDPELLSRPEAAAHLGVSVSSLAHWSMAGAGPSFVRVGRRSWYRIADLNAWIAAQVPARFFQGAQ